MTDIVTTFRAVVREELFRSQLPELGVVTAVWPMSSEGGDDNHQVDVRLRQSGVDLQRVPVCTARIGISCLPRIDDLVLVVFEAGDLNAPVVVGSLYDELHQPPVAEAAELVYRPAEAEDASLRRIHIELPSGLQITVADDRVSIEAGGTRLSIAQDGDVELHAAGNLTLSADGDVTIDAGGAIEASAATEATWKAGTQAALEGGAEAKVKGPTIGVAGSTQFTPS